MPRARSGSRQKDQNALEGHTRKNAAHARHVAPREFILRTILTNYNENGTVLISTHLILDVEQVLDEAVFLQQGQVVLHESTDSIRERTGGSVDELFRNMFRAPVMGNGGEYNAW